MYIPFINVALPYSYPIRPRDYFVLETSEEMILYVQSKRSILVFILYVIIFQNLIKADVCGSRYRQTFYQRSKSIYD